ncbi:MAG: hypothetical protein LLG97_15335 [Deltaproteobacteria bacterium]|nr:hypothetical protein [Deltaproteobacteria bacterium]
MSAKIRITALILVGLCLWGGTSRADETALFTTSTAPDALILLDLSGSMDWNPAGGVYTWGNSSCNGTFYSSSGYGHSTKCSRLDIAKRAIFDILDDNGSGTITGDDEKSLGVRIGYMRYYNGNDTAGDYLTGNNRLSKPLDTKYSSIFCNGSSSCSPTSTCNSSCSSLNECVNSECANSGTPLTSALNEAKLYLDVHRAADNAAACRQKFVILITDGVDTYGCGGDGTETQADMYKRRRESVARAKALLDSRDPTHPEWPGYRLFVIGFGAAMPDYMEKTLNWMAYFGGTDNPLIENGGSTAGYDPAAVTSCGDSTTTGTCDGTSTNCFATANDPGNTPLSGYAFLASDGDQLAAQLKAAINIIREATYSFSQSSIQSSRTLDENFIYEGSFQPVTGDPVWLGHLKKYAVDADGNVGDELWDAGNVLQSTAAANRNMKTYKAGAMIDFTVANLTNADLAVSSNAARTAVVGYFRGESAYNPENWKLGDVFRSTPITVGTPSYFFDDLRDASGSPNAFAQHRANHLRASSPYSGRVILVGANDGQLHAFRTSDGSEAWSFIPPNLLSRLKLTAHATDPSSLTHQYYVDGPVTVADAWVPSTASAGTSKSAADWKTLLIFGEGRGAGSNLWSSSASCDSGFNQIYTSTYTNYCGYYCLDVNINPPVPSLPTPFPAPIFKWRLGLTSAHGPYMGAPWSKPMVSRVLVGGNEKWVAFIGGGVQVPGAANSGRGFFVVDLVDGSILWSYTKVDNANLDYPMPAPPAIVDTDNDGFIDTVYLGDLGSNMWRFKLCTNADGSSCSTTNWSGGRLFEANSSSGNRPIYTSAAVTVDPALNLWIYWGTGDKTDPTSPSAQEKFFGIKDTDRTSTRTISDLQNITTEGGVYNDSSKVGYYINLAGQGEKMLSEPTVFGGLVYFTTFTPAQGSSDPCQQGGTASLFGLSYTTGAGALPIVGADPPPRSMVLGTGIPSAPVISLKPGGGTTPDLYVTTSGGGGIGAQTQRVNINPPGLANRTNMLYWRDRRVD